MSTLAEALAVPRQLEPFEGCPVIGSAIEIPNAAGGFQEAMKFEPVELHVGDEVFVVLRCVVKKVRFQPPNKAGEGSEDLVRVHVLSADEAAMVDGDLVKVHLAQQAARILAAKEEIDGTFHLPGLIEDPPGMWEKSPEDAHEAGELADGLHPDCGECNAEAAAQEAEKAALDLPKGPGLHSVPDEPVKKAKAK